MLLKCSSCERKKVSKDFINRVSNHIYNTVNRIGNFTMNAFHPRLPGTDMGQALKYLCLQAL